MNKKTLLMVAAAERCPPCNREKWLYPVEVFLTKRGRP